MRKIAIIKSKEILHWDDFTKIADSITDWSEVSEEDFRLLQKASNRYTYSDKHFLIIERVNEEPNFILKTIEEYLIFEKNEEEKRLKQKEETERKKSERLLKKQAKDEVARKALFEQLSKEFNKNV